MIKLYFLFLILYLFNAEEVHQKVLHTSILNFAPFLKLHHIVVIWDTKEMYTIDFSPINQPNPTTLLKLFIGKNVPAETRIRRIEKTMFSNDEEIIDNWNNQNTHNAEISELLTNRTFEDIQNKNLKEKIIKMRSWRTTMNLYSQNCQHFSSFTKKM
jgi:hypothetical protein